MADIKYNIDLTETEYKHFEGYSIQELESFLYLNEISEGLFISPQSARKCISELLETGDLCREVDWITPEELPEEGNYI